MEERLFKRKIYTQLLNWKQESDGKSALLVEGARRDGHRNLDRGMVIGQSAFVTRGKCRCYRVKGRDFQGESGVVIGIAADGAVISSGRC